MSKENPMLPKNQSRSVNSTFLKINFLDQRAPITLLKAP